MPPPPAESPAAAPAARPGSPRSTDPRRPPARSASSPAAATLKTWKRGNRKGDGGVDEEERGKRGNGGGREGIGGDGRFGEIERELDAHQPVQQAHVPHDLPITAGWGSCLEELDPAVGEGADIDGFPAGRFGGSGPVGGKGESGSDGEEANAGSVEFARDE